MSAWVNPERDSADAHTEHLSVIQPLDLPPGWTTSPQTPRTWALLCRGEYVAELGRSLVGQWRLCLVGESLPLPRAYDTPASAIAALLRISPHLSGRPRPRPRTPHSSVPATTPSPVLGSYFGRTAPPPRHRGH